MKKENNTLIISAILAIVILIALASCGSRKVESNKIDKQITTETKETKKDSLYTTTKNNIFKTDDEETVIYEPINNDKPFFINGISYINTRLINQKRKSILVDTTLKKEVKTAVYNKQETKQVKEIIKEKKIDKKSNYFSIFLVLLLFIGIYFVIKNYFTRFL
jgi:FtsZ-interacting cell division protein ZipA